MTNPIVVTVLAAVDENEQVVILESKDLKYDVDGFFLELEKGSTATVVFRLKPKNPDDAQSITNVRSVRTPDSGNGPWESWTYDESGQLYSSSPFSIGDRFRIEVDNSAGANVVPRGGGHFRVIEEGGGFTLGGPGGS